MWFSVLQVVTIMVISLAVTAALGHALEKPGKMRLSKEYYKAIQPIYYPGFTIAGGIGEAGGTILLILLVILTPPGTDAFYLRLVALIALIAMQAVYWLFTHPINKIWLSNENISKFSSGFFSFLSKDTTQLSWETLRNRWENSHVVRSVFACISLLTLVVALV